MLSRSEPQKEKEVATNKINTMFLYFGKSEPQRSYKHGSYKKKECSDRTSSLVYMSLP